ncbi:hypothetical protein GUJ93_ZPchr0010g8992 [Zizania palustris]|uniref:Reverse transcriptase zinc-binding domain-containing protein n=1 Tax=Zizania palustris TaxID=103762 RepID=A0A8J5WD62_ZIZPA|nr:hypothetical protein GUJ93_ZPchr0010g8992 [Zizania palustris]
MWVFIRDALNWTRCPLNVDSFVEDFSNHKCLKGNLIKFWVFAGCVWTLWLFRNDMVFQDRVPSNIMSLLYRFLSILAQWLPLTPMRLKEDATRCLSSLHARARSITNQPRNASLSDL